MLVLTKGTCRLLGTIDKFQRGRKGQIVSKDNSGKKWKDNEKRQSKV